jgi:hypothetical protein
MNKDYSILFQKSVDERAKDLQDDFGFVCTLIEEGDYETKELEKNEWADEHGEDVYIPSVMRFNGFELKLGVVYTGAINTHNTKLTALLAYLTGIDGALDSEGVKLYSERLHRGYAKVYLKSVTERSLYKTETDECLECVVTLQVADPVTVVNASTSDNGVTYNLN